MLSEEGKKARSQLARGKQPWALRYLVSGLHASHVSSSDRVGPARTGSLHGHGEGGRAEIPHTVSFVVDELLRPSREIYIKEENMGASPIISLES